MNSNKPTISAVLITYNEEKCISECLESIKWVDEIIILDSYSSDKTVELARKYTKKIYKEIFNNNFSTQRNKAINLSSSDWILVIDADELLSSNSTVIIKELLQNSYIDGYWFLRKNYVNSEVYLKHGYFYPDYQLRLFRNNKNIKYSGAIHEQPVIDKNKTKVINSIEIIHTYIHTKYNSFLSICRFFPYIKIEAEELYRRKINSINLIFKGIFESIHFFYRSYFRDYGYKDGYFGFIASFNYSSYRFLLYLYVVSKRIRDHAK